MKLIKPSVEFFGEVPTDYESALKFIEMAGRTCYKSEDKISEGSAEKFVRKLIESKHLAMVEHSNFVVRLSLEESPEYFITPTGKYFNHKVDDNFIYVGANLTAWYQQGEGESWDHEIFEPFKQVYGSLFKIYNTPTYNESPWQVCPHDEIPHELHRYSAKFICNRAVTHELVRHRPCSYAQESQRWVSYGGKDVEFIEPVEFDGWYELDKAYLKQSLEQSEWHYNCLLRSGLKPQQARLVLPNATKTEIVVTADAAEWTHIRNLRTAKDADPEMQRVMNMMPWEEFL